MIRRMPSLSPKVFHGLVTVSPQMEALFRKVCRAAKSEATILVRGDSGTGKEGIAAALHHESSRAVAPFRAVNCATFTPEMLASELFGHVEGAFTGAVRDHQGLLSQADGGTLFLDEVAEMPLQLQARLLRVLEQRRFTPLGGTNQLEVDVRLVSATNKALRELVAEGAFREDLMYRIRVVVLYLPRLIERDGDLEALTWHFIDRLNRTSRRYVEGIEADAWAAMRAYDWPGNVRELHNNLQQAFVLGEGPHLVLDDLAPEVRGEAPVRQESAHSLDDLEREDLVAAYRETGGRRAEMAETLGISRATLYRRLKKHGLL
jgi:two-component system response regulator AtoC